MNPVLMIMQPRIIPPAITSMRENWNLPRVWFKAFTEPQVVHEMNMFVRQTNYSHYHPYSRAYNNQQAVYILLFPFDNFLLIHAGYLILVDPKIPR